MSAQPNIIFPEANLTAVQAWLSLLPMANVNKHFEFSEVRHFGDEIKFD